MRKAKLGVPLTLALATVLALPALGRQAPSAAAGEATEAQAGESLRGSGAAQARCTAQQVHSGMSLAQRVGQLFVVGVDTGNPTAYQTRMIRQHHLGGAVLIGHSSAGVKETWRTARRLQRQARGDGVRLWVAADQEGGYVQVLHGPGFSEMPTALEQGNWSPSRLRGRAHRWGRQLNMAGVNLNLAPVLDTVPASLGRDNKPIGYYYREYGHTPQIVKRHGLAVRRGMHAAGVQTTGKHFPGLGRVRRNTDTSYGVHDDVTTRHDPYLEPFQAAVDDGIPIIMVSSARYTKIDSKFLAPFSPTVLRGMLRGDLNFDGVIMSDDLGAAAAVKKVPVPKRAVRFLRAGGTVVLTVKASTIPEMTGAVLRRARNVSPFRDKVNAAALHVLQAKQRIGLLPCQHRSVSTSEMSVATTDAGRPAGLAAFRAHGEHLYLCDQQGDGRRVITHVRTSSGVSREYQTGQGHGACRDLNFAISENGWIRFNVCLQDGASAPERHCAARVRSPASDGGPPAGTAEFQSYGEHLYLCDRQGDGRRVVTHVRTSSGVSREYQSGHGHGACRDLNFGIAESGWILFNVCLQDGGSAPERHCSRYARSTA